MKKIIICLLMILPIFCTISFAENDIPYLKTLRVDKEGIVPYFNKEINEYYLTVGSDISSLDFITEAEDENSNINIIGNSSFKEGINKVKIEVSLNNKQNIYYIYVTKTNNKEAANANLETLAIENVLLTPEFSNSTSYYKSEVGNNIEDLNILAIPENMGAKVEITGNSELLVGKNTVVVKVTAENGYSFRRYYIDIYRRNKTEETDFEEKQAYQAEKISALLEGRYETSIDKENENITEADKSNGLFITMIVIIVIGGAILFYYKLYNNKNKS